MEYVKKNPFKTIKVINIIYTNKVEPNREESGEIEFGSHVNNDSIIYSLLNDSINSWIIVIEDISGSFISKLTPSLSILYLTSSWD